MVKTALLGPHAGHETDWEIYRIILEKYKYEVEIANSVDKMLNYLVTRENSPPDIIIMETNQGYPKSEIYKPAEDVYTPIKKYNDENNEKIKFIAISYIRESVNGAKSAGIPAMNKDHFNLKEIRKLMNQ